MSRCTAAERDLRVGKVIEWVNEGQSRANIIRLCRAEWDIKPRTVDAYIKRAREVIGDEARAGVRAELQGSRRENRSEAAEAAARSFEEMPGREAVRLDVLNMLYEQYAVAKLNGDVAMALKAAEKLAELVGVRWADLRESVEDDAEDYPEKVRAALALFFGGAQALREQRGLPAIPQRPVETPASQGDA